MTINEHADFTIYEGGHTLNATGTFKKERVIREKVVIGTAAASKVLAQAVPAGSFPTEIRLTFDGAVTLVTAVKVGLGVSGNPDALLLTGTTMTDGTVTIGVPLTDKFYAAETVIGLFACDTNGAAAGTLAGTIDVEFFFDYLPVRE